MKEIFVLLCEVGVLTLEMVKVLGAHTDDMSGRVIGVIFLLKREIMLCY